MNTRRVLIKLGGAALETSSTLDFMTRGLAAYQKAGYQVILVHGGGPAINAELRRLGITWEFVGGQRVTSHQMMDVIEYTLGGTVNRRLLHHFSAHHLAVSGCSGAETSTLICTQASGELGQVGKIENVNTNFVEQILAQGKIPIVAPLGVGTKGERYNINADWAASHLAVALGAEQLLFLTDQVGVLDEEGKSIAAVDAAGLHNMIDAKTVSGGMLTKVRAVLHALEGGLKAVRILSAADVLDGVPYGSKGTTCTLRALDQDAQTEGEIHAAI